MAREAELRKTRARLPPAVYYVPRGGEPTQVADGIARPNGVHLSRDEKTHRGRAAPRHGAVANRGVGLDACGL